MESIPVLHKRLKIRVLYSNNGQILSPAVMPKEAGCHREPNLHGVLPSDAGGEGPGRCDLYCDGQSHRVHILVEMKQGQCICPLSWSVHCNCSGEGKCNERGWACTPHPHQPGLILPSSLNVRQKAAVATLCTLWTVITACHDRLYTVQHALAGTSLLRDSGNLSCCCYY